MFFESEQSMGNMRPPKLFPDENSEGVFNALLLLLPTEASKELLADYKWERYRHPPTWLLTLDRHGFMPASFGRVIRR